MFGEIHQNFQDKGYLTPEELFAIVIWKSNRAKTKVLNGFLELTRNIEQITKSFSIQSDREKVLTLNSIGGIGVPIASAILAVCYPDRFTVVDYRAKESLKKLSITVHGNPAETPDAYLEYVSTCVEQARVYDLSLRDFDRALWGLDFYEGAGGLAELVELYQKNL